MIWFVNQFLIAVLTFSRPTILYVLTWKGSNSQSLRGFREKNCKLKVFCPSVPKTETWIQRNTTKFWCLSWKPLSRVRILMYRTCYYKNLQIYLSVQGKVTNCRILSRENKIHHRTLALNHSSYKYFFSLRKPHKQSYFWYLSIYTSYNETLL